MAEEQRLGVIYDEVLVACSELRDIPALEKQDRLVATQEKLEKVMLMLNELGVFSDNEELEEVATKDLRYLIAPALLADLLTQKTTDDRLPLVKSTHLFFSDFLRLAASYQLFDPDSPYLGDSDLSALGRTRDEKIAKYKEEKELEEFFAAHSDLSRFEEEVVREYYIKQVKFWIQRAKGELTMLSEEEKLIKCGAAQSGTPVERAPPPPASDPMLRRPFIITRNTLQKSVYGAGYPSLPTYTVEEFYDMKLANGELPVLGGNTSGAAPPAPRDDEEPNEEAERTRLQTRDELRDNVRRGEGNMYRKG